MRRLISLLGAVSILLLDVAFYFLCKAKKPFACFLYFTHSVRMAIWDEYYKVVEHFHYKQEDIMHIYHEANLMVDAKKYGTTYPPKNEYIHAGNQGYMHDGKFFGGKPWIRITP